MKKLEDHTRKITKIDYIIMTIMVILYGILSFINLGDMKAPQTYKKFNKNDFIIIPLEKEEHLSRIRYYTGNNFGDFSVYFSTDGVEFDNRKKINTKAPFIWKDAGINNTRAKYVKIQSRSDNNVLGEIQLYDNNHNIVKFNTTPDNPLTDEQDLVPTQISFMNSTYFDEVYYMRTSYEYVNGIDAYEWTHPPLGKLIISIPMLILGFSPFSSRLMGNIIGILLIPVFYILVKRIFKNRKWATFGALLMMFDCFHFVHTRITLIDGIQILFILLSIIFMKDYLDLKREAPFKYKAYNLFLSGFFIGCAISTKWNACYAALGLAIVFFIHLLKYYNITLKGILKTIKEYANFTNIILFLNFIFAIPFSLYFITYAFVNPNSAKITLMLYILIVILGIVIKFISKDKYLFKLFLVCIGSFIITPLIIYIGSYLISPPLAHYNGSLSGIGDMTKMMYDYHSKLVATHNFSSKWYQWPIMYKPVWFYVQEMGYNLKQTIVDIGNPAIWWFGIATFIFTFIRTLIKKDKVGILIVVFALATYIPYIFISRLMFMYHYFITLPFIMLSIVAFMKWLTEKTKKNTFIVVYLILVIAIFIMFYPIISGMTVSDHYVQSLKWLNSWVF